MCEEPLGYKALSSKGIHVPLDLSLFLAGQAHPQDWVACPLLGGRLTPQLSQQRKLAVQMILTIHPFLDGEEMVGLRRFNVLETLLVKRSKVILEGIIVGIVKLLGRDLIND